MSEMNMSVISKLTEQRDNIVNLLALLTDEKVILGNNAPDDLDSIIVKKNDLLSAIQTLDTTISLDSIAVKEIKSGIHSPMMAEIDSLLAECRALNNVNGEIIQRSEVTVNRIRTSILEGQGRASLTYDEKAKTSTGANTLNIKA